MRIERALKDSAYAALAEPGKEPYEPLTAESVAERPTRAPAKKAQAKAQTVESGSVVETPAPAEPEQPPVTTVARRARSWRAVPRRGHRRPKKRTRRGSRGGRRRRKPSGAGGTGAANRSAPAASPAATDALNRRPLPKQHDPSERREPPAGSEAARSAPPANSSHGCRHSRPRKPSEVASTAGPERLGPAHARGRRGAAAEEAHPARLPRRAQAPQAVPGRWRGRKRRRRLRNGPGCPGTRAKQVQFVERISSRKPGRLATMRPGSRAAARDLSVEGRDELRGYRSRWKTVRRP